MKKCCAPVAVGLALCGGAAAQAPPHGMEYHRGHCEAHSAVDGRPYACDGVAITPLVDRLGHMLIRFPSKDAAADRQLGFAGDFGPDGAFTVGQVYLSGAGYPVDSGACQWAGGAGRPNDLACVALMRGGRRAVVGFFGDP
ncbi:MAG: hypothetical protein ACR2F8_00900 [Caulobacteraceae bacterium]